MTNITNDDGCGNTTTEVVTDHDRGSTDFNRRRGEANTAEATPVAAKTKTKAKTKKAKAEPETEPETETPVPADAI